jgi:hypothetical protein
MSLMARPISNTEGDDWTQIVAAGSKAVVGEVRPPEQDVTDLIE